MEKNHIRMARLKTITELLADQALAPVEKANRRMNAIEAKADQLAKHRQDLLCASVDPTLAGTLLAQAERLRQQQAVTLQELAKARVIYEQEKAKAARAVGKDIVLGEMLKRQDAAAKLEKRRRVLR